MSELSDYERACILFSVCCEPGDEAAGLLRSVVGTSEAAKLVLDADKHKLLSALFDSGGADLATSRFGDFRRTYSDSLERWLPRIDSAQLKSLYDSVASGRFHIVTDQDLHWPRALTDLGYATPPVLWVAGQKETLSASALSIALVGSRAATNYGQWVTGELVTEIIQRNHVVVSGGAYGIDAIAHRAALMSSGKTIAVLAGGIDRLYPTGNQELFDRMMVDSLVVAELPPGSSPTKWRFLQRNRLIAALGRATVVVEAGWRSGSINTANHASGLGRVVGAVPGAVTAASSAGCHRLIRESVAELVTCGADIFELLGDTELNLDFSTGNGVLELRVRDFLTSQFEPLERVALKAGTTPHETNLALTSLELQGIAQSSYSRWRLAGSNL